MQDHHNLKAVWNMVGSCNSIRYDQKVPRSDNTALGKRSLKSDSRDRTLLTFMVGCISFENQKDSPAVSWDQGSQMTLLSSQISQATSATELTQALLGGFVCWFMSAFVQRTFLHLSLSKASLRQNRQTGRLTTKKKKWATTNIKGNRLDDSASLDLRDFKEQSKIWKKRKSKVAKRKREQIEKDPLKETETIRKKKKKHKLSQRNWDPYRDSHFKLAESCNLFRNPGVRTKVKG